MKRMAHSVVEEFTEMKEELQAGHWIAAVKEFADMIHAITWIFVFMLPNIITESKALYVIVFFLAGIITPYKQGVRYIENGCIRSPRNCKAGDHTCESSKR